MAIRPAVAPPEATVETACPLDCPDACTLNVTVRGGRITVIDRPGLERESCECYAVVKREYDRLVEMSEAGRATLLDDLYVLMRTLRVVLGASGV